MRNAGQHTLIALMGGLHEALHALFVQRQQSSGRRRHLLQRRLLLGVELMAKIEEQVVLPALHEAEPDWADDIAPLQRELELLRDVSMLAVQTISANREVALSVLEGMAALHATRLRALLGRTPGGDVDWAALDAEVRALLGRWRSEVEAEGDVEDEDRDPVGLAPR